MLLLNLIRNKIVVEIRFLENLHFLSSKNLNHKHLHYKSDKNLVVFRVERKIKALNDDLSIFILGFFCFLQFFV